MVNYFRTSLNIYLLDSTINNFMKYNPPCKDCLVQCMCLLNRDNSSPPHIRAKTCNILYKFIKENRSFHISEFKKRFSNG